MPHDDGRMSSSDPYAEFLLMESARVNEASDAWFQKYGFEHKCRCAEDYIEGNVGTVPACWAEMADTALNTLARYRAVLGEHDLLSEVG